MILKEKIEDFLHPDRVRMVYIKKSSKIRLKFQGEIRQKVSKKGVFIKNISKGYQNGIKSISILYQKVIKAVSIEIPSIKPPQIRFKRLFQN